MEFFHNYLRAINVQVFLGAAKHWRNLDELSVVIYTLSMHLSFSCRSFNQNLKLMVFILFVPFLNSFKGHFFSLGISPFYFENLNSGSTDLPCGTKGLRTGTKGLPRGTKGLRTGTKGLRTGTKGLPRRTKGRRRGTKGLPRRTKYLRSRTKSHRRGSLSLRRNSEGLLTCSVIHNKIFTCLSSLSKCR